MKKMVFISFLLFVFQTGSGQKAILRAIQPHHAKLQFAGSIGYLSAGVGYRNRKQNVEGDVFYGYVPKRFGGMTMHALSAKATIHVLPQIKFRGLDVRPLSGGVLLNYTFGKQYFLFSPENYPYNYYGFPTVLHAGFFAGGNVSARFHKKSLNRLAVYYELGTNDAELKSYLGNNSIPLKEILNLAIGIKTTF